MTLPAQPKHPTGSTPPRSGFLIGKKHCRFLLLRINAKLGNGDGSLHVMSGDIHLVEADPLGLLDDLPSNVEDNEEADVDI